MSNVLKIQCPSCGASQNFEEKEGSRFVCGYCGTQWEQFTAPTSVDVDQLFLKELMQWEEKYKSLTRDRPKYDARVFEIALNMNAYLTQIQTPQLLRDATTRFQSILGDQIARLERTIDSQTPPEAHILEKTYLSHYYCLSLERTLAVDADSEALQDAIDLWSKWKALKVPHRDREPIEMHRCYIGVLNQLGREEEVYQYVYNLLNEVLENAEEGVFQDPEQLHYELEFVTDTEGYRQWLKNK